jgi:UDP-glucose 4-epimerase
VTAIGVTGASGFLGRYLVDHIAKNHDADVRALTRTLGPDNHERARVSWIQGDLNSPRDCAAFIDGVGTIVHLAHVNTPLTSNEHLSTDALVNLVPSLTLLQAIRDAGGGRHVVFASSGGALYEPNTSRAPLTESAPVAPVSSYGIQKLAFEHYLRMAVLEGWLTATVFRIGNAYGTLLPRERLQGFIGVALNHVLHDEPIRVFGDWNNVRDYVHLEDLSRAFLLAADLREGFSVLNIGSGRGRSVREILSLLEEIVGEPIAVERDEPTDAAARLPSWVVLDSAKASDVLGWEPQIDLEQGLRRLWEDVRAKRPR